MSEQSFQEKPRAAAAAVEVEIADLRLNLPAEYLAFLRRSGGGDGFIGDNYIVLYGGSDLAELNKGFGLPEAIPGLFLIGSDGGGEALALDMREPAHSPVVRVPFIGMEPEKVLHVAGSFGGFLAGEWAS